MEIRSPRDLGAAVRGRRRALKLSQAEVAEAAGVSRPWLAEFEAGKPTVELARVLSVLEALEFSLDLRGPHETPGETPGTQADDLLDLGSLMEEYDKGAGA
ncbi:MAG TPA: helix-turn-helix domain-containing protein [Kribbella sp.]